MAFDSDPTVADKRRKMLVQRLMGRAGGGAGVPMPSAAAAEGRTFRGVGNFRGAPHAAMTHASNVLASVLARLGGMGSPGLAGEVSPGLGRAIDYRPTPPPFHPPIAPPIPTPSPVGGSPVPATGPITPAPGSSGPGTPSAPPLTGSGGGDMLALSPLVQSHLDSTLSDQYSGGGQFIPLGGGLAYDPINDRVVGSSSSAGGAVRRL